MAPKTNLLDTEMMLSPCKKSNRLRYSTRRTPTPCSRGLLIAIMLEEHANTFANMESYAKDLLEKHSIEDTSPKAILKMMLIEGLLNKGARICTKEGDKIRIWKQTRAYNTVVSDNLARDIIPELEITDIEPIAATAVAELVKKTNEAL
jgi:hypothetical protein